MLTRPSRIPKRKKWRSPIHEMLPRMFYLVTRDNPYPPTLELDSEPHLQVMMRDARTTYPRSLPFTTASEGLGFIDTMPIPPILSLSLPPLSTIDHGVTNTRPLIPSDVTRISLPKKLACFGFPYILLAPPIGPRGQGPSTLEAHALDPQPPSSRRCSLASGDPREDDWAAWVGCTGGGRGTGGEAQPWRTTGGREALPLKHR